MMTLTQRAGFWVDPHKDDSKVDTSARREALHVNTAPPAIDKEGGFRGHHYRVSVAHPDLVASYRPDCDSTSVLKACRAWLDRNGHTLSYRTFR